MKAHTSEKQEIILSIGMIVKNEEKVLERCLKSLQPLMKAIPSELIIADTGSTDSTVEIAKKYTDNVFHFEWINDFAAARNSTLEKAKGKWYFFLDADEYLDEDIHEIVEFFKIPELYNHYKTIQINLRNYFDNERKQYNDAMLPRFQRIKDTEKVEFIGSIHETIYMRFPLGYFQTILHHTGYSFQTMTQNLNKKERNLQLMREEYEKTPPEGRYRILSLLLDGTSFLPEESEKYIAEALNLVRNNKNNPFSRGLYVQSIFYYKTKRTQYALKLCNEYYEVFEDADNYVATVSVAKLKADILAMLGNYEEACQSYCKYFLLYKAYKEEKIDLSDCAFRALLGLSETEYIDNKILYINCLLLMHEYDKAFGIIEAVDTNNIKDSDYTKIVLSLQNICVQSKQYKKLSENYSASVASGSKDKIALALSTIENTFYSLSLMKEREAFAKQFVESGEHSKYIELMNLQLSQQKQNFKEELIKFIDSVDDWKVGYTEAIYLAVKNKLDIIGIVDKMPASLFGEKLNLIANTHDDFAGLVLEYGIPEQFTANIKRFSWIVTMHEVAAFRSFELNDKKKYELYLRFTNLLGEYVANIYNPELLQDEEDIAVLPPLHKFGYYMLQANNNLMNGDSIGYIKEMKNALLNCEAMKEIVEFMLEQFKIKMGMQ